jgi:hypothetical protein
MTVGPVQVIVFGFERTDQFRLAWVVEAIWRWISKREVEAC